MSSDGAIETPATVREERAQYDRFRRQRGNQSRKSPVRIAVRSMKVVHLLDRGKSNCRVTIKSRCQQSDGGEGLDQIASDERVTVPAEATKKGGLFSYCK